MIAKVDRVHPTTATLQVIASRYPTAAVTFLCGSVLRGQATATSDLDLVVVYARLEAAYRESFVHAGWPVEAFVHDLETLRYFFFEADRATGVPMLPDMVVGGVPLPQENDLARSVRALAKEAVAAGPRQWTEKELAASRYMITNLVDDIRSPRSRVELTATGTLLYSAVADHFLRSQRLWSARGKTIPRHLESVAPAFAARFVVAFAELFTHSHAEPVIQLCDEVLAPSGGRLFEGFKVVAPAEWRASKS